MMFAANVSLQTAEVGNAEDGSPARALSQPAKVAERDQIVEAPASATQAIGGFGLAVTLLISVGFAVGLFFLLPLAAVGAAHRWVGEGRGGA